MNKALARDLMMNVLAVYADKRSYDQAGRLGYGGQLNVLQDGGGTERHWWGHIRPGGPGPHKWQETQPV